jgi:hypothetical protein
MVCPWRALPFRPQRHDLACQQHRFLEAPLPDRLAQLHVERGERLLLFGR